MAADPGETSQPRGGWAGRACRVGGRGVSREEGKKKERQKAFVASSKDGGKKKGRVREGG